MIHSATVVDLAVGDRVYIKTFHDYGADRLIFYGSRETNLQIIRIPGID
jgi:hypothetical protein